MRLKTLALVALLLGSAAVLGTSPASATPLTSGSALAVAAAQQQEALVIQVQRRRTGRRGHHHRGRRHHGHGFDPGAAAAIGVIGAIGTMMAVDAARRQAEADAAAAAEEDAAIDYCLSHFKSYDIETGTYRGFDGYRHPCP